jgi:sodium/potassium-transporting ATPase subunit alpha
MKISSLPTDEVFRSLVTSGNGLSEDEAARRLYEFGYNEIEGVRKKSLLGKFLEQFTHFLAVLLWIAAFMSFLSALLNPGEGMFTLGIAITAVIFINAVFTFVQEYRAERALEAMKELLPFRVRVMRDGREIEVPAREIVPGDVIFISGGDKVPADSRLIETSRLTINIAPLTGESEPVTMDHEPSDADPIESRNIAFAGTTVVSGSGKAVVFASGMKTEFGRIAHLTSAVETGLSPLQKEIVKVTRIIAFIATVTGVLFFMAGFFIGRSFWENFIFAIGIIVANVPEGLLPTVTLSLALGSQRMAKKMALIKTLTSVETLGSVTVVCTDKTGTLTMNMMEVKTAWVDGETIDSGMVKRTGSHILATAARLCNNARFMEGEYRGDPTEVALIRAYGQSAEIQNERVSEIPFDPERKLMTTVNRLDGKTFVFTKGATESLLPLCSHRFIKGKNAKADEEFGKEVTAACQELMDRGLRVISFAYRNLTGSGEPAARVEELEKDLVFIGLVGLEDPPRPEVPAALKKCCEAGIRVIMITGDGDRTAVAVAREIGLVTGTPVVIDGYEFRKMGESELREKLSEREVIFARMTPRHKMRVVSVLKDLGERVAVTGDGVNDAPALKKADIGIAMGITGTDVAKEAADMILLDDNFATIVNAIEEGRAVYENIRKFISYIFSSNIPEIIPYIAYVLFSIPLPLTIMQILAVDLGTDMLPALALGAEKPSKEIMSRPPRGPRERLLSAGLLARAYLFLGPFEAAAALFGFFYVLHTGGWLPGEWLARNNILYLQATTACLTAIIVTQIANVFACRSSSESIFRLGFLTNRLIFAGIAVELILQLFIVYNPFGNRIFATYPISINAWLVLLPFAPILFFSEELRKFLARRTHHIGP